MSTNQTFSVRLAVVDDGKVKATLLDVGHSGEKSFQLIENASHKALHVVSDMVEEVTGLKINSKGLAGALAGAFAANKIVEFTKSAFEASDELVKMANLIGINVESLQELRYAASLEGIDQETTDKALQKFTKNLGEAAYGGGKAVEAFKQLKITLVDNEGQIRKTEDVVKDVSDALSHVESTADLARLSTALFGKEGGKMALVLGNGAQSLEKVRQQARDLGIILEKDLVEGAEKAGDQVEILNKAIKINLSRAVLDLAPLIGDSAKALAGFAADAGVAYEKLKLFFSGDFEFKGLSKNSTESLYRQYKAQVEGLQKALADLGEPGITDDFWKWNKAISLKAQLDDVLPAYQKYAQRYEEIQQQIRESEQKTKDNDANSKEAIFRNLVLQQQQEEEHAGKLVETEQRLQADLFELSYQGAAKIDAERKRAKEELAKLADNSPENQLKAQALLEQIDKIYDLKAAQEQAKINDKIIEQKQKTYEANQKIIQTIQDEREALGLTDREQAVNEALRRLSADATEEQRQQVKELAAALYDEKQAHEALRKEEEKHQEQIKKIKDLYAQQVTTVAQYRQELADIQAMLKAGEITEQEAMVAIQDAQKRMLESSREWQAGLIRGLDTYADAATNMAANLENVVDSTFSNLEDVLTDFTKTGKLKFSDMIDHMLDDIARLIVRTQITGPLAQSIGAGLGSLFGFAQGGAFINGMPVHAFARGGVVNSPTIFPMAKGMGLMGEAGPEAVMPLTRYRLAGWVLNPPIATPLAMF